MATTASDSPVAVITESRSSGSPPKQSRSLRSAGKISFPRSRGECRSRADRPRATSTSVASRAGGQPSARRPFVPSDAALRGEPGTANTRTPRSIASLAVTSEPPRTRDSTTTTASDNAARMRLRAGKRCGPRRAARGHLGQHQPDARDLLPEIVMLAGIHDVEPARDHADGCGTVNGKCAPMSVTVDAARQPGDDTDTGARQVGPEFARDRATVGGGGPRADDGDTQRAQGHRGRRDRTTRPARHDRRRVPTDSRRRRGEVHARRPSGIGPTTR